MGGSDLLRRDTEARIRELLPGCRVRVIWTAEGEIGDVLVDGDSALPETMARVAALPGVVVAPWDPSPGRIGTVVRAGERLTRVAERPKVAKVRLVGLTGGGPLLVVPVREVGR